MVFNDSMSIGDKLVSSLAITILGMVVVFAVLVIIAYSIEALRIMFGDKDKKKVVQVEEIAVNKDMAFVADTNNEDIDLILLITAAIAYENGKSTDDFFVKSIKSVPQKQSVWATTGRLQQMSFTK